MKALPVLVALVILLTATVFAQTTTIDILYLKNGSIIRGQVIELAAGNVKIKTADGSLFVFSMLDVEKMIKETTTPAPVAAPAPTPTLTQTPAPTVAPTTEPVVTPTRRSVQEPAQAPEPTPTPVVEPKKKGASFALRGGLFANLEIWNNLGKNSQLGISGDPDSKVGFGLMGLLTAGVDIDDDLYFGVGPHLGANFWRHSEKILNYETSVQITPLDFGADFAFGFDDMYFVVGFGSSSVSVTAEVGNDSQTVEIPEKAPYTRIQIGWSDGIGIGFAIVSYDDPFKNLGRLEINIGFSL